MSSRYFDFRLALGIPVLLMALLRAFDPSPVDFALARLFYEPGQGFIGRSSFWLEDILHDRAKQALMLESDRPHVLREMIYVCRPAGIISIPGVYGGLIDKIPFGAAMNKGLTFRMGQTHVNRWTDDLLNRIQEGQIDPSFVITHSVSLEQGPEMYKTFRDKHDGCIKVVLKP